MFTLFEDGPEYRQRQATPFRPTKLTLEQVRAVIPQEAFQKSTSKAMHYVIRDIICAVLVYKLSFYIDPLSKQVATKYGFPPILASAFSWCLWAIWGYCQGITLTSWWVLAHEAGHGNLFPSKIMNHLVGFPLHTFLLVPYFSWRSTHLAHHKATASVEKDQHFIPKTRSEYNLPDEATAQPIDYHEIFEETPIYTLLRMIFMQALGLHAYFLTNIMGSPRYPPGTNHYNPSSALFTPKERTGIILSDIGLAIMTLVFASWTAKVGYVNLFRLYIVPWLWTNHWIVMITYLHHSDPTIAHYRGAEWSFLRGALSTVDRPLLGWVGRFFFHNISHDHIAHHVAVNVPFYNGPEVTARLREVLKEDYNYDSTNTFRALYRTFTQCIFIEDNDGIVLYKNRQGKAARTLASPEAQNQAQEAQ